MLLLKIFLKRRGNFMKNIKISLIAVITATSFSSLGATPLEEAIKDVDVSGSLRYRYDSFVPNFKDGESGTLYESDLSGSQRHEFRALLTTSVSLGDGFKAVGTLNYNPDGETDGGFYGGAQTKLPIYLEEAYLRYDSNPIFATSILLGRQRLGTIWTDNDSLSGSVGMKAQLINKALPGVTLTAFAVDSVNDDGDFIGAGLGKFADGSYGEYDENDDAGTAFLAGKYPTMKDAIFAQNLYGAAVLLDYGESVGLTGQAWFGYVNDRMAMYAVDLGYTLDFKDAGSLSVQAQYLANNRLSYLKSAEFTGAAGSEMAGGALYTIATGVEFLGFDASVGYTAYGKKDKFSVNVLEDMGDIITAGEEIQNTSGSSLHGDIGANQFVFGGLGYTIADLVRVGVDYAWGQTKRVGAESKDIKDKKQEIVGRLEYKHSDNLAFSGFYSYLTHKSDEFTDSNGDKQTQKQNSIRFEARYDF